MFKISVQNIFLCDGVHHGPHFVATESKSRYTSVHTIHHNQFTTSMQILHNRPISMKEQRKSITMLDLQRKKIKNDIEQVSNDASQLHRTQMLVVNVNPSHTLFAWQCVYYLTVTSQGL